MIRTVVALAVRFHALLLRSPALLALTAVGGISAVLFLNAPELDLAVTRTFYAADGTFIGQHLIWLKVLRSIFITFYFSCVALTVAGIIMTQRGGRSWLGWRFSNWAFLAICLVVGPGLIANTILKDNWGRARPKQVVEFNGTKSFSPPLLPVRECPRNCSFVSGEAASAFLPLYAAAAVMPQNAILLAVGGTLLGLAAGAIRIVQGAHFLSDVIFAGVFMGLTVLVVWHLMFGGLIPSPARLSTTRAVKGGQAVTP
jgi:lipid A 4'-phosphatase